VERREAKQELRVYMGPQQRVLIKLRNRFGSENSLEIGTCDGSCRHSALGGAKLSCWSHGLWIASQAGDQLSELVLRVGSRFELQTLPLRTDA
jgi:hypothetical protein